MVSGWCSVVNCGPIPKQTIRPWARQHLIGAAGPGIPKQRFSANHGVPLFTAVPHSRLPYRQPRHDETSITGARRHEMLRRQPTVSAASLHLLCVCLMHLLRLLLVLLLHLLHSRRSSLLFRQLLMFLVLLLLEFLPILVLLRD